MGRLALLIQAAGSPEERRFATEYNLFGEKESYRKPDGVSLHYTYDALGRLSSFYSSDGSVHYVYSYDRLSHPIRVDDLVLNRSSNRKYDLFGNVIEENLANGLTVNMLYNTEGKIESLSLPDRSGVSYFYEGPRLKKVSRLSSSGAIQYSHIYDKYDSVGRLESATLINGVGKLSYKYNLNNAIHSIIGPNYQQENTYDQIGNLTASIIDNDSRSFEYDGLNQLKKEDGPFTHVYSHDSLYNRASRDGKAHAINSLNQILSDGVLDYSYDLSGNLISSSGGSTS
jgi:YD repeat-containing protein